MFSDVGSVQHGVSTHLKKFALCTQLMPVVVNLINGKKTVILSQDTFVLSAHQQEMIAHVLKEFDKEEL